MEVSPAPPPKNFGKMLQEGVGSVDDMIRQIERKNIMKI